MGAISKACVGTKLHSLSPVLDGKCQDHARTWLFYHEYLPICTLFLLEESFLAELPREKFGIFEKNLSQCQLRVGSALCFLGREE